MRRQFLGYDVCLEGFVHPASPRNKDRLGQSARGGPFYLIYFVRAVGAGERRIRGSNGILLLELATKVVL
jgi:hypothetical protein